MTSFVNASRALALMALLALAACGADAPVESSAPARNDSAPAVAQAPEQADSTPNRESAAHTETAESSIEPAAEQDRQTDTDAVADTEQNNESESVQDSDTLPSEAEAEPAQEPAKREAAVVPEGPEPRLGVDYQIIDPPQPLVSEPGKVEIAVVFSYTCIHCARLDPLLPAWEKTLPAQVNAVQVPMAHGPFEPIARGFYAAEAMGVLEKTHHEMFKALAEQQRLGAGKLNDVAKVYAGLGIDADALKATANSFAVNTKIKRNQHTVARWGIEGTPSIVVAGKYRVAATSTGGHQGMLQAARWLAQKELADKAE